MTTRVALNLVYLVPGETGGMEVYARELLPRLAALPDLELVAIVSRRAAADGAAPWNDGTVQSVLAPVDARDRKQWVWGEQWHVPKLARWVRADLIHSLASTGPGRLAGGPPRVTTVHDLHYAVAPEAHFGLRGLGMRLLVPAAVRASRRVIADSQSTKDDVVAHIGTDAAAIDVVHLATTLPPEGAPVTPEPELRARLELGERPLLLSLAAKRPHKNVEGLIDALALLPAERRPLLVVPGYETEHEAALLERARERGVADVVRFPGWLSRADVEGLWRACAAHVFPSFYEGFGLPVLEAMARGVPGACSDRASMPEVAGDAALLFDPSEAATIATAIERLIGDEPLRALLRERGLARAATFSWERTARETARSYELALAAG
ncbi:glycosyltransferase family 1 protein [Conexibacter sp. JD483]|uniref:glycosyltransferase family 4 protein n=1 Tax=unclassified Conexibacter TaxID=2627773 RepID=UPI002717ED60|nr:MULTISPECIES: glycosyltransferase family 1 protein [unclassified Conexibacter]MDO8184058.1 glycosyltransferase family 1 protein [Conexibacter sp. CPCC 205706]MDO8197050.1 glycosyltransferase family 1 protein [Conexibacter sp. CPCC 205762]MDR9367966.1 glycosyltransferase family 1 protein [Conexibacter sp. JD483]